MMIGNRHSWITVTSIRRLCAIGLLLLLPTTASATTAPSEQTVATITTGLSRNADELEAMEAAGADARDVEARQALRLRAQAVQSSAADAVRSLNTELALIQARETGLAGSDEGTGETLEVHAQRHRIEADRSTIGSAISRARLIDVRAREQLEKLSAADAEMIGERLSARTSSPLSPLFWIDVSDHLPNDFSRLRQFADAGLRWLINGLDIRTGAIALGGVIAALLLAFPIRSSLRVFGRRLATDHGTGGRVRRSGYALWLVMVGTVVQGLAAFVLIQSLQWAGLLSVRWSELGSRFVGMAFYAAFVSSLFGSLLLRDQPTWRLLPIGNDGAATLRRYSWTAAALVFGGQMLASIEDLSAAGIQASTATNALMALLHLLFIAAATIALGRLRAVAQQDSGKPSHNGLLAIVAVIVWLTLLEAIVAGAFGYVNFALKVGTWMTWAAIVGATLYLLTTFTDDMCRTLLSSGNRLGRSASSGFGVGRSTVDQFGVLLSAFLRLALTIVAIGAAMAPFGADMGALFAVIGTIANGVTIGQITISPSAVLSAVAVLLISFAILRVVLGWLDNTYLPTTTMDSGTRNSVTMIVRYAGTIAAGIWALSALGIGMDKLAVVLGALSVGIGFGLQAITQNFVSGLILLAERPVKIGDWIRIGSQEGDVKRISVRSTEIQMADRSTLIVPNSELITKTIQNMTPAAPIGRIQLHFSVPIETDVEIVRTMLLGAFAAEPEVLDDPEAKVFIDSIDAGRVTLNCFAHVSSPRHAYEVRSALLFALMGHFRQAGIEIGTMPTRIELVQSSTSFEWMPWTTSGRA